MEQLQNMDWLNINGFNKELFQEKAINFGFKVLGALAILIIGWFLISWTARLIKAAFKRSHMEPTAATFLESFINIALKGLLLITVVLHLGVKESSILALLGTIGLAIGMALQGSLSNFAGGVLILVLKPFKVGDFIEVQNFSGKVDKIQVFNSRLLTPDNKAVTIPNGTLANSIVINHSAKSQRRVDIAFNVSYNSDINEVKKLLMNMIVSHPKILQDPEPFLRLTAQAASSLTFTSRSWVNSEDYWEVYFDLMEQSKQILDKAGIEIPYNKLDINVLEKKTENNSYPNR